MKTEDYRKYAHAVARDLYGDEFAKEFIDCVCPAPVVANKTPVSQERVDWFDMTGEPQPHLPGCDWFDASPEPLQH